ncbi:hypothetical protein [Bartonella rattimassiliensis]|uniref:Uncharacterized protein n=1 Tax=Bartonella rattimassiliensis 15908 TaxID=1094556 RepID=J0QQK2_9HYPH|nr:hypothetical protein [Bartonella rattimassiliensis]EJF85319.1 hypothetical protein MCY_01160 [Bartonella rattimassiliensis 15908]
MKLAGWYVHHNLLIQNQMLLLNHNDYPATIFELAVLIVIAVLFFLSLVLFFEDKIKESILTMIIALSSLVWLFSLNNVSSATNC